MSTFTTSTEPRSSFLHEMNFSRIVTGQALNEPAHLLDPVLGDSRDEFGAVDENRGNGLPEPLEHVPHFPRLQHGLEQLLEFHDKLRKVDHLKMR